MRRLAAVAAALCALALSACADAGTAPRRFDATGTWSGTDGVMTITLQLTQSGTAVGGTGTVRGVTSNIPVTATGTAASQDMTLTLASAGYQDVHIAGTFADERSIDATLTGSGFTGDYFSFTRQ